MGAVRLPVAFDERRQKCKMLANKSILIETRGRSFFTLRRTCAQQRTVATEDIVGVLVPLSDPGAIARVAYGGCPADSARAVCPVWRQLGESPFDIMV